MRISFILALTLSVSLAFAASPVDLEKAIRANLEEEVARVLKAPPILIKTTCISKTMAVPIRKHT